MIPPDWVAVDWGTSQVRAWAMSFEGEAHATVTSDEGMAKLTAADYEAALFRLIEPWLKEGRKTPVIACGMVGSREGWTECPYVSAPCIPGHNLTAAPALDKRVDVQIGAGIKQKNPADVMRGEETQIAGFTAKQPEFDGVICLPGTHSKWVCVGRGRILAFQTFLTGELFGLLADSSTLRDTVSREGWESKSYLDGVNAAFEIPSSIASALFSLRAEGLLNPRDGISARSRLSGYLIGIELAATRHWWKETEVVIIGSPSLSANYESALHSLGARTLLYDSELATLDGLKALFEYYRALRQ